MKHRVRDTNRSFRWLWRLSSVSITEDWALFVRRTWPAICDIWLGKRTLPVLAVAKEVAALQSWLRSRSGRAEDRSTTNCGETFCLVICLSFVWMFFFPSRSNNRLGLLIECSKLTCFEREKATWFLGGEIDDRRRLLSGVLAGRRASWKRGK